MLRAVPLAPRWTWTLGALACAGAAGAGLVAHPGHLLGSPGGEVWGHAWVQWWRGQALPAWPPGTDLALGAGTWPVIDPLPTLLLGAAGRLLGVVAAWNLGLLLFVAVAFLGGAWLARREGGEPVVGGLALALAPCFLGSLSSGLTEDGALGLSAVVLGLLARPTWRGAALAGALLALLAATGLLLAWSTALAALLPGLWALSRDRRAAGPLLLGALLAALLVAPLAWTFGPRLLGEGHRAGEVQALVEPLWRLNPWRGVDLASLVAPLPQEPGEALIRQHPGYLGLSLLVLAALGSLRPAPGQDRGGRWWSVALLAVLLAPGEQLSLLGQPLGLRNPLALGLDLLPGGALVNHHGRLLLPGAVALSVLAARGADSLRRLAAGRLPRALPAAVALVAFDLLLLAPGGAPLPTADPTPPALVADLGRLSPGRLLVLPVAGPGVHFQRPLLDQRLHGRPLLLDPQRPGLPPGLAATETGRWLGGLALPRPSPPPADSTRILADLSAVAVLLVAEPHVAAVAAVLGPPDLAAADGGAWDLARRRGEGAPPPR